ncbi:uncharacterized protein LOC114360399, partial [Ostrinia furnacalis]|uniref:uncharacterized protein LOC114360399 n=1 Tax=Ostrinia furnacalis TaxID=93504 RepID=UPI00103E944B
KLSSLRAEAYPSLAALRRTKDQLRALARAVLRRPVEAQLESKDEEPSEPHILEDLPALLLDSGPRAKLSSLRAEAYPSLAALRRTKDQLRALARAVLRRPVEAQLGK